VLVDVAVAVLVRVADAVAVAVLVLVGRAVFVDVAVSVLVAVAVAVSVGGAVAVCVGIAVAVSTGLGVVVAALVEVEEDVAELVGVVVRVLVTVAVVVLVRVAEAVAVLVRVAVGVLDGVDEAVAVPVDVASGVSGGVAEGSWVLVDSEVAVSAGMGDAVFVAVLEDSVVGGMVAVWTAGETGDAAGSTTGPVADECASGDATGDQGDELDTGVEAAGLTMSVSGGVAVWLGGTTSRGVPVGLDAPGNGVADRGLAVACGEGVPAPSMEARPAIGDAEPGACASCVARRSLVTCVRSTGFTVMTISCGCALERVKRNARIKQAARAPSATDTVVRFKQTSRSSRRRPTALQKGPGGRTSAELDSLAGVHFTCAALNMQWKMSPALDKRGHFHILARGWATRTYGRSCISHVHRAAAGGPLCWQAGCSYQE